MANTVKDFASPNGPILLLSAKGLTTAGIAEAGGVNDFSGNCNHGQAFGGLTVLNDSDGFSFDGSDDYINIAGSRFSSINGVTGVTLFCRFKCSTSIADGTRNLVTISLNGSSIGLAMRLSISSGVVKLSYGGRSHDTSQSAKMNTPVIELTKNQWYTCAIVADTTNTLCAAYIDGSEFASITTWHTDPFVTPNSVKIGSQSGSNNFFNGHISDVRIYPRALSAAEVKYLHNGCQPNIIVGQNTLSSIQVGSSAVERIYFGNSLVYAKTDDYEATLPEVCFELHQINETNQTYPIVYTGKNAAFSGITYSNSTPDLGQWEKWINVHFTPVMLRSNGTVDYELNRDNQNYKKDGTTASDVANLSYDGNAMLRIKKFYISCSTSTTGSGSSAYDFHTIKISDMKKDSSYTCWGFVDANGNEKDYVYYALYNCHKDSNNKLRSISGVTLNDSRPGNQLLSYNDMVAAAKANGTGWDISNLALENAIGLVIMMLYKSVNPTFINQETGDLYRQSSGTYRVTGTRNADGGFPYVTAAQKQKALWIESFWRNYDSMNQSHPWINGLASLRTGTGSNDFMPYYKKQPPYDDFTTISNWTLMSSTTPHAYMSDAVSHELKTVMFYDNIMFPKDDGVARQGSITEATINRYFGGGEISGSTSTSLQYTDRLLPAQTCGGVMQDQYSSMPHYLGYSLVGTGINNYQKYGSGRLIYMPS